jgi:hypothetical protein
VHPRSYLLKPWPKQAQLREWCPSLLEHPEYFETWTTTRNPSPLPRTNDEVAPHNTAALSALHPAAFDRDWRPTAQREGVAATDRFALDVSPFERQFRRDIIDEIRLEK